MSPGPQPASSPSVKWEDARLLDYRLYLLWGWNPVDAAFAAYFGKPFQAVLTAGR